MARTDPTIYMKIPETLKAKLDQSASDGRRSLTAEVVDRLERSFQVSEEAGDAGEVVRILSSALAQQADTVLAFVDVVESALAHKGVEQAREALDRLRWAMTRHATGDREVHRQVWSITEGWSGYDGKPPAGTDDIPWPEEVKLAKAAVEDDVKQLVKNRRKPRRSVDPIE